MQLHRRRRLLYIHGMRSLEQAKAAVGSLTKQCEKLQYEKSRLRSELVTLRHVVEALLTAKPLPDDLVAALVSYTTDPSSLSHATVERVMAYHRLGRAEQVERKNAEREQGQMTFRAFVAETVVRLLLKEGTLDEEIFQHIVKYSQNPQIFATTMAARLTEKKNL